MRFSVRYIVFLLVIGLLLLAVPLLGDFHIESALLAAVAGCFCALWMACKKRSQKDDGKRIGVVLGGLYVAGIPIFAYSLITGCLSWHGIGFWVFYPVPSVLFGYNLGRLLRIWNVPFRRAIGIAVLLFIAIGVLLIEFFQLPQVYFFNHVWGGWPGPIYDETVKVGWSLVFYRGLTIAWAGLLWWMPTFRASARSKVIVLVCGLLLIIGYSQLAEMGIITPRSYLQEQLGGRKQTAHFTLYYDRSQYTAREIGFIGQKQEFYFKRITDTLNVSPEATQNIESYLYAHPWQKKKLVGAKFTSYVPVWLEQDQLHIAKPQIAGSLEHELVHVLSKQFGNRLFNASWSIGLIEGLAVALAPAESARSTIDQIVVSEKPYPTAAEMKEALSVLGFWGGRSAVNYTQTGSFVRYLLNRYPVEKFKQAYKTGNLQEAYNRSMKHLVNGWHIALDTVSVDATDQRIAERLYGFPSLFEQPCPHVQSVFAGEWDQFQFFMAEQDTARALQHLAEARRVSRDNLLVKTRSAYLNLKVGNVRKVQHRARIKDRSAELLLLYADAFMIDGKTGKAKEYLAEAARRLDHHSDKRTRAALKVRQNRRQWIYHLETVYNIGNEFLSDSTFNNMVHRTQVRAMKQAINHNNWTLLKQYARLAKIEELNALYFETYIQLIERLAYMGETEMAQKWLKGMRSLKLRSRFIERLNQTDDFHNYLQKNTNK